MTHADALREAERAVLMAVANRRAAQRLNDGQAMLFALMAEDAAYDEWECLRAETCPMCGGDGEVLVREGDGGPIVGRACCPSCDAGRRRDAT